MPRRLKAKLPPLPTGPETIGERIARFRKAAGLTQSKLAEKIGIKRSLVTDYEIGRLRLNGEMIVRFALALTVSADLLLGLADASGLVEKPDLKVTRRLREIERLPPHQKRSLLLTIDAYLKANPRGDGAD
jgi:transcriptional regulator with XRE-family HTH domain